MKYDASKDLKINYQINHALWLLGESNEKEVQLENCDEEVERLQEKELGIKYIYDKVMN